MAAAYVGDQSRELAQECLQVHGGIGYTWEHDLQFLLKRARSGNVLFGDDLAHRMVLADLLGLDALEEARS